jgi:hypothetical protein
MNIMKHKIVTCVFATVALCSGIVAHPQERPVKLEFKVDQKVTDRGFELSFRPTALPPNRTSQMMELPIPIVGS